jgi:hypothetical protein
MKFSRMGAASSTPNDVPIEGCEIGLDLYSCGICGIGPRDDVHESDCVSGSKVLRLYGDLGSHIPKLLHVTSEFAFGM